MRPAPRKPKAARLAPAASVKRHNKPVQHNPRSPLPQWVRPRLKATLVALGVRGWITPALAQDLLARWQLTHE